MKSNIQAQEDGKAAEVAIMDATSLRGRWYRDGSARSKKKVKSGRANVSPAGGSVETWNNIVKKRPKEKLPAQTTSPS